MNHEVAERLRKLTNVELVQELLEVEADDAPLNTELLHEICTRLDPQWRDRE